MNKWARKHVCRDIVCLMWLCAAHVCELEMRSSRSLHRLAMSSQAYIKEKEKTERQAKELSAMQRLLLEARDGHYAVRRAVKVANPEVALKRANRMDERLYTSRDKLSEKFEKLLADTERRVADGMWVLN